MSEFQHAYEGGEAQCTHCRGWTRGANLRTECPTRLRVEVERLREMLLNAGLPLVAGVRTKGAEERAWLAAWLREDAEMLLQIERGELRSEEKA